MAGKSKAVMEEKEPLQEPRVLPQSQSQVSLQCEVDFFP